MDKNQPCSNTGKIKAIGFLTPKQAMEIRILSKFHHLIIGIDPGVQTGFAVWDRKLKNLDAVKTFPPFRAIRELEKYGGRPEVLVRIEDARLRKVFDKMDAQQAKYGAAIREGAGWAKAHSSLWEEVVQDLGLDYQLLPPRQTKWAEDYFKKVTGWTGRTSNHARDAASNIFGL